MPALLFAALLCTHGPADFAGCSPADLDARFAGGSVEPVPPGFNRGRIVLLVDTPLPRLKAKLQGLAWKGKQFDEAGGMVNRWLGGVRAISTQSRVEASWFDGQPCVVLDYPPGTPVFANARDEIRCVGPGVYLGRFYERCPCPRVRGYFVLEAECGR